MDYSSEEFRRRFPHLAREFEEGSMSVGIDKVQSAEEKEQAESADKDGKRLRGFSPGVVDFLRRCDSLGEAEAVVGFLADRGEVSEAEAERLRAQLREKGLRSFGSKKEHGHYFSGDK